MIFVKITETVCSTGSILGLLALQSGMLTTGSLRPVVCLWDFVMLLKITSMLYLCYSFDDADESGIEMLCG